MWRKIIAFGFCKHAYSLRKMEFGLWLVFLLSHREQRQLQSRTHSSRAGEPSGPDLSELLPLSYIEVAGAALGRGKSVARCSWYTKTSVKVTSASCDTKTSVKVTSPLWGLTEEKWTCVRPCESCPASTGMEGI